MKTFLNKINKKKTIFFSFFINFFIFPQFLDAESRIIYEDFKTNTFTEANPSVFTFHSLSGSAAEFNMNDITSSLVQIDPASNPITSICNGKSLIGGYQVFGQNFDVLQITFPLPKFNRSYFEWGITLDIYEFSPSVTLTQSLEVYLTSSPSTYFKVAKNEIPGTVNLTNHCSNSKISKFTYSISNSQPIWGQSLYLLNSIISPITLFYALSIIYYFTISPDGMYVATASSSIERVEIFNLLTGVKIKVLDVFDSVDVVAYSNDGLFLATGHSNGAIKLWNPSTWVLLKRFQKNNGYFHGISFSPDSRHVCGSSPSISQIWDIATETLLFEIPSFYSLKYSPDGSLLYGISIPNRKIQVWNASSGIFIRELKNSFKTTYNLEVSSSGSYIAAASNFYNFLYVCEALTGNIVQTYESGLYASVFAFSPNEEYIVSGDYIYLQIWETFTGKLISSFKVFTVQTLYQILFPPNGAYFLLIADDRSYVKMYKTYPFSPSPYPSIPGVGYYGFRNLEIYISLCDQSCEHCAGSEVNCLLCVQNAILSERPGKCTCPSGFYWVSSSNSSNNNFICSQCSENCLFCTENNCLSCKPDTFMTIEGDCVNNCPDGWFPEGIFCQKCNDSCLQCSGTTANNCSKCGSNKYLVAKTGSCELCDNNCEVCEGINQCTKCVNNYFFNESLLLCQESLCGQNCEVCKDLRLCKKCLDSYFLEKVNFCQKKEVIFVTLKEISNPTLFSLEFSNYSSYIDRNLENIFALYLENYSGNNKITHRKIPWPKYYQKITNNSYSIMPIYNTAVPSDSLLKFKFSVDYSHADANYFTLSPENLAVKLFGYLPCNVLTEYYSNQSIIKKTTIVLELQYTNNRSIFELKFTNSEVIEFFPSLVKNFSKILIDELKSSDFTHDIVETSNTTFSLKIILNKSVVMRPKLEYFIDIPIFYSLNNNFLVDPPQASIDIFDYYLMDKEESKTQNDFVKQNIILSYFVEYLVFVATILTGSTSALQCLMISNLIQLTQYNEINYPTNLVEIYETTLPSFPTVFYHYQFPIAKKDENVLPEEFMIFDISPYFLDNVGETISRNCVILFSTTILNCISEKIKNTTFFFVKILNYFRNFFVWQFFLCFLLDSLVVIVYFLSLNIVYVTFSGFSGIFNYFFSFFILGVAIYLLNLIQTIIENCQNYKRIQQIENIKSIPEINNLEDIPPITLHQEIRIESMNINELAPTNNLPHFDEILQENFFSNLQIVQESNKLEAQIKNENENLPSLIHPIIVKKCEDIPLKSQVDIVCNKNTTRFTRVKLFFSKLYNPNQQVYLNDFLFLHNSLKNKAFSRYFFLFQIMLQIIIAIVLAGMHSYPLLQMIVVNVLFLSGILILVKNRPFEVWLDFIVELLNEIFTQIFLIIVLALAIMDSLENKDEITRLKMGKVAVIMALAIQYLGCFISLIEIIIFCIKKILKLRDNSNKKKEDQNKIVNN